ncbi:M3 family metallopeptidase [Pseudomarimonas salicorniae]|uniref:M3 family metallopeptidase n=1 Tax=Pseudomarimonas salicorniae TaxID=2933270 RepID=A0ABT0GLH5_9GAMM|nr:M3 family metallopeptidase [Lysobacter sp. CAU 1642]MCK7595384.1 M3 family metallopeptidase [Lysobacter sp. CAU 1642]
MKPTHVLALAIALALSPPLLAEDTAPAVAAGESIEANPLVAPSTLPLGMPHFDRIRNEHFAPALDHGMRLHLAEIEAIANNPEPPSFENTVVAMERSGDVLRRVGAVFGNLNGAHTNPELQKVAREFAPRFAAHQDAITLNDKLYQRLRSLHENRETLDIDAESKQLIERYYTDFVRAGAQLSAGDKETLKTYNAELARLQTAFGQNVLASTNASAVAVDDKKRLDGLASGAIAAAEAAAKQAEDVEAPYLITLQNTSSQPALSSLHDRSLRETLLKTSITRSSQGGEHDNRELVRDIVRLRAQRAALLGYANHAAYQLEEQTAGSVDTVNKLLSDLSPAAVANARAEASDIQQVIEAEGGEFKLAAWDWPYYAEKVRQQKFEFDAAALRPYFELENVLFKGVFHAAKELYGLGVKERKDLPTYHPDVRVFEVFNEDGSRLAILLLDLYARPSKRGGAWANSYVLQSGLLGTQPVMGNHLNIPKPTEGEPTLMTFDEVTTLFHEFGHNLHGMFSDVHYPRFAGTQVPRDFVEYPSQVNEMWATWPSVLANYAVHYQTGEPIPKALLDKVLAAEQFNQGYATTEYLAASVIDQAWHQITADQVPTDVLAFEAASLKKLGLDFEPVPPRYRSTYFNHIFAGGYSAGYYSYMWSEVLDADSVEWFKENGGLKRENGDHFRKTLLSRGGSKPAMELFEDFRGRAPDIAPLLKRRGLEPKKPAQP